MNRRLTITARSTVAVLAALVAAAGCGGSGFVKAGGTQRKPRVLTLANANTLPGELQPFADEVAKRSGGTLRIAFRNDWRQRQRGVVPALFRDVKAGRVDMGWLGTREWEAFGVTSFDALHAPFLIQSYALEQTVFDSSIPDEMLRDVEPLGVVGIGVLPGPLRYLLSAPRPLRRPTDFDGLRIGYSGAGEPADALRALGARPVPLLFSGAPWRGIDAVEQQLGSIDGNAYDRYAKYLTANAPLWPRPLVVFMNKRLFGSLTRAQQAALRDAAHAAIVPTLSALRTQDRTVLADLCRRGLHLVTASGADADALRAAVAPIVAQLRRDPDSGRFLASILTMSQQVRAGAPLPPTCPHLGQPSANALPAGTYTTTIAPGDIPRSGRTEESGLGPSGVRDILRSRFTLALHTGSFVLYQRHADGHTDIGIQGTYSVYRDRFVGTGSNGDVLRAGWSFDGTRLRFSDVTPKGAYAVVWGSEPWLRRSP